MKVKRHDHTGGPAKAHFHRLFCRGISNAPVEESAKTYPDMYLRRHTHTGCPQRHVYTGSFAEASSMHQNRYVHITPLQRHVHITPLQRHVHITPLQRHVHMAAPTDAGPYGCICRGMSAQMHQHRHVQTCIYTSIST